MTTVKRAGAAGVVSRPNPAAPPTNSRGCAQNHDTPWRVTYEQVGTSPEELQRVYGRVHQILFDLDSATPAATGAKRMAGGGDRDAYPRP